ncbi:DGQHR domain-containing protein [Massilia sp. P8910]|uniref:DGQHR domain-containing protein n=1 Tax=Massilia antarctica TaxID=2765360 RepID=UPI001E44E014|nr:DGQHR domain-containing protein [Massilia antarctica]
MATHPTPETNDPLPKIGGRVRYSMSFVTQGSHRFYTLTMPSEVLASCCFATSRDEDPITGFQRVLDERRAQEIADYMDLGFGTIPNSIILSAQPQADMQDVGRGKTLEFTFSRHSFLIIDGQHRVFGFAKAKTRLRVPVVIYNGLSKQQESKLFIDINTKQRPVPNELLLDIKKLADSENDDEIVLGELFDAFNEDNESPLVGLLSPAAKASGKLSRVTFYAAIKPVLSTFATSSSSVIYPALRSYVSAFYKGLITIGMRDTIVNPTVFRAVFEVFPEVAQRVVDRYGPTFNEQDFSELMVGLFGRIKPTKFQTPPRSYKELGADLSKALRGGFVIG